MNLPIGASCTPNTAPGFPTWPCKAQQYAGGPRCWRPEGHGGRHAFIGSGGEVLAVWGEDVHAETRARGRAALTAKANGRIMQVVDLIAEGADPDDAWATVEAWAGEPS